MPPTPGLLPRLRRRPRYLTLLVSAAVLVLVVALIARPAADEPSEAPDDQPAAGEAGDADEPGRAHESGERRLRAAVATAPDHLDPHLATSRGALVVLDNVYDTLVAPDGELTMTPALAEAWEVADDGATWAFELRDDAVFHDGSPVTADDVVASLERIATEGEDGFRLDVVDGLEVVDEHTFLVHLARPAGDVLERLGASSRMAIVPADALEAGTLDQEPIGSGPFRVADMPGERILLERFEEHHAGPPALAEIELRVVDDADVRLVQLSRGVIDWVDTVTAPHVAAIEDAERFELSRAAGTEYYFLAPNHERAPFDDLDVRRAVALALDLGAVADAARPGRATPTQTPIPDGSRWRLDHAPFGHDPEAARALLAEAGAEEVTTEILVTDELPETVAAAGEIAEQLGEVGITAEVRVEDLETFLEDQGGGDFETFVLGWPDSRLPREVYVRPHHSEGRLNFHAFADEEVDELLDRAGLEADPETRVEVYRAAGTRIVDLVSYVHLYHHDVLAAFSTDVRGYTSRPDGAVRFGDVDLERAGDRPPS